MNYFLLLFWRCLLYCLKLVRAGKNISLTKTMSLPPRTKMCLTVFFATKLPKLKAHSIPRTMAERLCRAKDELEHVNHVERCLVKEAYQEMYPAQKALNIVRDKRKELEKEIEVLLRRSRALERLEEVKEGLEQVEVEEHCWFMEKYNKIGNANEGLSIEMHEEFCRIRERKCTLKKELEALRMEIDAPERLKKVKEKLERVLGEESHLIEEAYNEMNSYTHTLSNEMDKRLEEVREKKKELEDEIDALPKDGDPPNPFVVVAFDDEEDIETKPMLYTKAVRNTSNPIWEDRFEDFPLEMYLTGKTCYEIFHNGDDNYRPRKLTFYIYHDDRVEEKRRQTPKKSDDSWKRDNPQRDILIGKAEWLRLDLCSKIGSEEFEKKFPIMNPHTNKKIKDAFLTIKVRLSAPKGCHCSHNCNLKSISGFEVGEKGDKPVEIGETHLWLTMKQKKKYRTINHGDSWPRICRRYK